MERVVGEVSPCVLAGKTPSFVEKRKNIHQQQGGQRLCLTLEDGDFEPRTEAVDSFGLLDIEKM